MEAKTQNDGGSSIIYPRWDEAQQFIKLVVG